MLHSLRSQLRGKHPYNPLQSQTQKALLPSLPFPWTTLYLLRSTASCSAFSPPRREDKQDGVSKPRPIQQKEGDTDPSFPALYPHSCRSAESRGVLRRVRPPCLVHKDHHRNGAAIGFPPQESLWEPSTGCTRYSPGTRLPHNRAMQLLSKWQTHRRPPELKLGMIPFACLYN